MVAQSIDSEAKTPSDGQSTNAIKTGGAKRQPPSKADAFGIFLSALSVMESAGVVFDWANDGDKSRAYLAIDSARWEELDTGLAIKEIAAA